MAELQTKSQNLGHLFLTGHPGIGKTTIIIDVAQAILQSSSSSSSSNKRKIRVRGFYTEECRNKDGNRVGFDIVYWPRKKKDDDSREESLLRAPLSRLGKPRKGDPAVGKYIVDVESIDKYAVPSIESLNDEEDYGEDDKSVDAELILLDEFGKMEMKCETFLPAVKRLLDTSSSGTKKHPMIVLGTMPTPRYGRVIPAVEDLRAREDVTRDNRDVLREEVKRCIMSALGISCDLAQNMAATNDALSAYLYSRPIGSSSMHGTESKATSQKLKKIEAAPSSKFTKGCSSSAVLKPCGPLIDENVPPSVLILGETASAQPNQPGLEYCERSMWIILSDMFQINYTPIKDTEVVLPQTDINMNQFADLRQKTLSSGIAIWDVLSDVHDKSFSARKKRMKKNEVKQNPNQIEKLLDETPSIQAIAFIGQKAKKTFGNHRLDADMTLSSGRVVNLVVLPSSSRANSRMTVKEKSDVWTEALGKFCPGISKVE